jgi:hypothetical protein
MDRTLQYLFGGVASSALIAAAVAAFISITALVGNTGFPDGSSVPPPSGPQTVRIGDPNQPADFSSVTAPAGPVALAVPTALQATLSSPLAVRQLASVGRELTGNAARGRSVGAGHGHGASSSPGAHARHPAAHNTSPGGPGTGPSNPGAGGPSSTPTASTPLAPTTDSSSSPGLASKPGGIAPGQAKKSTAPPPPTGNGPSSTPPGLASKPGGLPPGLAKKPGGLPPGQAKKH